MNYLLLVTRPVLVLLIAKTVVTTIPCCPTGWLRNNDSCYFFSHNNKLDYFEASLYCQQHGAHLVHVNNASENTFLKDFLERLKDSSWWMGLSDQDQESVFNWPDDPTAIVTYFDWYKDQPNNGDNPNEDCVIFHQSFAFKWTDVACNATVNSVCEKPVTHAASLVG